MSTNWKEREPDAPGAPVPFSIHEQDRAVIRDNIVEAVVHAPDIIRLILMYFEEIGIVLSRYSLFEFCR